MQSRMAAQMKVVVFLAAPSTVQTRIDISFSLKHIYFTFDVKGILHLAKIELKIKQAQPRFKKKQK